MWLQSLNVANGRWNCGTCFVQCRKNQWNAHKVCSCLYLLTGLLKCETRYQEFPNMLFSVHFMMRVGEVLCGLKLTEDTSVQVWRLGQLYQKRSAELNDSLYWKLCLIDRSLWKHRSMVLTKSWGSAFSAITVCKTMALSSLKWSNSLCCWEISFNKTTGAWSVFVRYFPQVFMWYKQLIGGTLG